MEFLTTRKLISRPITINHKKYNMRLSIKVTLTVIHNQNGIRMFISLVVRVFVQFHIKKTFSFQAHISE